DGFIEADWQWSVQVSVRLDFNRHELVPGHLGHGPENSAVQGRLADLVGEVLRDHSDRLDHLLSLFLKRGKGHDAPFNSDRGRLKRETASRRSLANGVSDCFAGVTQGFCFS